jgi:hypothetical protein
MLKKSLSVLCIVFLASVFYVSAAHAEVNFKYGAAFRLRHEVWDDVVGLDALRTGSAADRAFFRLRTNLWGQADFSQGLGAYVRFTNEMKYYTGPYNYKSNDDRYDPDELIFDNLYADAKNVFGLPVDLRIGRQDFIGPTGYGEYLLFSDGTPNDGSPSISTRRRLSLSSTTKTVSTSFTLPTRRPTSICPRCTLARRSS